MDQEKLIEGVKSSPALYSTCHSRYSDNLFKENAWRAIAKQINQPAAVCKKTWTTLRDSFRRAAKRKRETMSGQASKIKKWKFEDKMSFLLPFMQERDAFMNLAEVSDEDNKHEQNTEECNDNRIADKDDDTNNDVKDDDKDASETENEKSNRTKMSESIVIKARRNEAKKPRARAKTGLVTKYLLKKRTANATTTSSTKQLSASESFFASIATTVENFSPYYQNIAKSKIFAIVTDLEMQQIMQEEEFLMSHSPTPLQSPANVARVPLKTDQWQETEQYNAYPSSVSPSVSAVTTPNPSPSTSATPTPPLF